MERMHIALSAERDGRETVGRRGLYLRLNSGRGGDLENGRLWSGRVDFEIGRRGCAFDDSVILTWCCGLCWYRWLC